MVVNTSVDTTPLQSQAPTQPRVLSGQAPLQESSKQLPEMNLRISLELE